MSSVIFTDQHDPNGRTIRFNLDMSSAAAAQLVEIALGNERLLEILNEHGDDPIFVNPERVATITPVKED